MNELWLEKKKQVAKDLSIYLLTQHQLHLSWSYSNFSKLKTRDALWYVHITLYFLFGDNFSWH